MTFQVAKTTAPHRPNSMTHHCTAARAPQEPCWQEFQPAWIHHMPSPNHSDIGTTRATHHVLLAGTSANNTPSSLLARTPASTRFITEKAPACTEFKPHPRWQELSPAISSSSTRTLHRLAGQNFIQHSDSWIHHNPSNQSATSQKPEKTSKNDTHANLSTWPKNDTLANL